MFASRVARRQISWRPSPAITIRLGSRRVQASVHYEALALVERDDLTPAGIETIETDPRAWMRARSKSQWRAQRDIELMECGGLYWHMVDLLWVALFTLLYLVR